jgi:thiamine transporter ThiT
MKKHRLTQVPPLRFGIVIGLINGFIGLLVTPVLLLTLGAAATAADLNYAPKLLGIPWLFAGAASLFMPVVHAVGGFLFGVLLAMVYNFAARWTGGIVFYTDDSE